MSTTTTLRRTPCSARHATIASALQLVWVALAVLAGTPTDGLTALGATDSVAWLISGGVLLIDALHRRLTGLAGERCTHCADLNLPALQPRHHTRRRLLRAWHPAQPLTSGLRVAATGREDRTRPQVVPLPDGTRRVQAKPPRADLLTYPHLRGRPTTVLVRRTHDLDLARQLAGERWLEHATAAADVRGARCAVIQPRPLVHHRAGWWTTTPGRTVPHRGAVDEQNRVVVWCDDPADTHAAGPGIEFRP